MLQTCSRFKNCKTNGLHAHHPRDCFFYLRDYEVAQLQSLLKVSVFNYLDQEWFGGNFCSLN